MEGKPVPGAIEAAEAKLRKEHIDVEKSMDSIHETMKGIMDKEVKMMHASTPQLKKQYKKQIKSSKAYVKSLFITLEQEMWEHAEADYKLECLVDE